MSDIEFVLTIIFSIVYLIQIVSWIVALAEEDFKSKRSALLNLIPFYWFLTIIRYFIICFKNLGEE